jgi:hypothetical protein
MEHMKRTSSGFFFEAVDDDTKVILAAKIPTEVVRYMGLDAPVYISFRKASHGLTELLCSTFAVEDDPEAMFFLYRTHHDSEIALIRRFLQQDEIEIHAFDELNRNIASFLGQLEFDTENVSRILESATGSKEGSSLPESPEFGRTVDTVMDKLKQELPFDLAAMCAIRFVATSKHLPLRRTILAPTDAPASPGLRQSHYSSHSSEAHVTSQHHMAALIPGWKAGSAGRNTRTFAAYRDFDGALPASQPDRFSQWEYPLADNEGDQLETRLARLFGQVFSDGSILAAPSISVSSKEREFMI